MSPDSASNPHIAPDTAQLLWELMGNAAIERGDSAQAFHQIARAAATLINAERTGVWLLSPDRRLLRCVALWQGRDVTELPTINIADCPNYFSFLEWEPMLIAADVHQHPAFAELVPTYLNINNVVSALHIPARNGNQLLAVLTCESSTRTMDWRAQQELLGLNVAMSIARTLQASLYNRMQQAVHDSNRQIQQALLEKEQLESTVTNVVQAIETLSGQEYLDGLCVALTQIMQTDAIYIATRDFNGNLLHFRAGFNAEPYGYHDSPDGDCIDSGDLVLADQLDATYPQWPLAQRAPQSYVGVALPGSKGVIAAIWLHAQVSPLCQTLFRMFGGRIVAELKRLDHDEQLRRATAQLELQVEESSTELRRREQFYGTVFRSADIGIVVYDNELKLQAVNEAALTLLNCAEDDLRQHSIGTRLFPR